MRRSQRQDRRRHPAPSLGESGSNAARSQPVKAAIEARSLREIGEGGVAAGLAVLVAVVFAPAVGGGFVNLDDPKYLFDNELVPAGLTAETLRNAFTTSVFHNWAPLTILSLALDTSLFGTAAWGYHLTNVLVHAATAGVLFLALASMTGAIGRSAAATLLFAVHPLRVESVAWIAERKDVLSVFFVALALLAYERYCRRPSWRGYGAVAAAMLASLLAKATAVTLPVLLLILDVWPLRRADVPGFGSTAQDDTASWASATATWRWLFIEKLPLFVLSAIFAVTTIATQATAIQAEENMPLVRARLPNAAIAVGSYLWQTFIPIGLHPAHEHPGVTGISLVVVLAACGSIVAVTWLAICLREPVPACAAGIAWFFLALLPVLGIVTQQGFQSHADRFTYVPHVGLMIAIVWTTKWLVDQRGCDRRIGPALSVAAAVACILLDWRQIGIWRDSLTLWSHVVAVEPSSTGARVCLGMALADHGDTDAAITELRYALTMRNEARAHYRLGMILADRGDSAEACVHLLSAADIDPGMWRAHLNAGIMLARMNRLSEALERLELAAALKPAHPDVVDNIRRVREAMALGPSP